LVRGRTGLKQTAIEFELRIAKLFKRTHGTKIKLDLTKDILLDSQSTMDLICEPALVEWTFKSSHSMRLKSNGRTMEVKKQAMMLGYHAHVWYNKKAPRGNLQGGYKFKALNTRKKITR
jgi:hypothetical protein